MPPTNKTMQHGKAVLHMYSRIMEAYRQGWVLPGTSLACTALPYSTAEGSEQPSAW